MRCDICNSDLNKILYPGILKCDSCGHIFADQKLTREELKKIYNNDYFHGEEYSDYIAERATIEKNFLRITSIINNYITDKKNKNVLEVGSAYGYFLNILKDKYKVVKGLEIFKDAADYARKEFDIDVKDTDLLDWNFDREKYDLVCMWDVIEHLYSPQKYLSKISENMNKGGILAFTTGDIGSTVAKVRGKNWRQIHPPSHAHYFNRDTIEKLLNQNGFKLLNFGHFGRFRSIEMIAYIIFVQKLKIPFIFKLIKKVGITKIITYLNLYDEMIVIAKKVDNLSMTNKRVILHADDFGLTKHSSDNILECFKHSLNRTSIMPNGEAFDYAINKFRYTKNKELGIHLNIIEGKPVSDYHKIFDISDKNGFKNSFLSLILNYYLFGKRKKQRIYEQVKHELKSQIKKVVLNLKPEFPIHIDSHQYIHCIPFISDIIIELSKDYNITSVRHPNELLMFKFDLHHIKNLFSVNIIKYFVLKILSRNLKYKLIKNNIGFNDYFIGVLFSNKLRKKDIIDFLNKLKFKKYSTIEILFHPGGISGDEDLRLNSNSAEFYNSKNREFEKNILIDNEFKSIVEEYNRT